MGIDVENITPRIQYLAAVGQTEFDYPFAIFAEGDLVVSVDGVPQSLETDYTVEFGESEDPEDEDTPGVITFVEAMTGGEIVTIVRDTAIERVTDAQQNGPWTSAGFNDELDKAFVIMQEQEARVGRALRIPMTAEVDSSDIELDPANFANKYLTFDADGKPTPADLTDSGLITQDVVARALWPRTAAELAAGITPTAYQYEPGDVRRYGAVGDGVTDDTAAFQTAVSVIDAANGGPIYCPTGTYRLGVVGALPFACKFFGAGPSATVFLKATASSVFTVEAFYIEFHDLTFDADVATSSTYGTSGAMVDYTAGFTSAHGRMINCNADNLDTVVRFAGDAGYGHEVLGGYWQAETLTAGSEGRPYQTGNGGADTGAMFRRVTSANVIGEIDLRGAIDSHVQATDCRRIRMDSDTTLLTCIGGRWGSLGAAVTIDGEGTKIIGVAISGDVTLAATMSGSCVFADNAQTSGTFTDSSPTGVCMVRHRPLSVTYTNIGKHTLTNVNSAEEIKTHRVGGNQGDAAVTLALDSSPTVVMYNTALTADRAVTLPASGRPGYIYHIKRASGATGAFNINVGSGPLYALGTASTWCEVIWSGPSGAWIKHKSGTV